MSADEKPRRSALRWIGRKSLRVATAYPRGAWEATNPEAIRLEAQNIQRLWTVVRSPRSPGVTIVTGPDGSIDVPLTAELGGVTAAQVEVLLAMRLRRTATTFWACVSVATAGFLSWVAAAIASPPEFAGVWSGVTTLILTLALGAKALEAALHNWQVRTRRLGGVGEFFRTADTVLPSRRGAIRLR
ncbi:hypothetical protein E2C06_12205 [Dankookia rubra]|uniref:Uncharacterized protein n=1 Tax=Dankookia rubra TaxID=1442381 RepID=A0A4R5QGE3_9PROT|nr:hypothetical protein [Dankookia rubra]TDH62364.1 hypothetical protein E2C06_12205 [Dankookia rubra]